jgi:hypothetical protein
MDGSDIGRIYGSSQSKECQRRDRWGKQRKWGKESYEESLIIADQIKGSLNFVLVCG